MDNEFLEAPKAPTYATNLEELEEPDPDKIKNEEKKINPYHANLDEFQVYDKNDTHASTKIGKQNE